MYCARLSEGVFVKLSSATSEKWTRQQGAKSPSNKHTRGQQKALLVGGRPPSAININGTRDARPFPVIILASLFPDDIFTGAIDLGPDL